MSLYSDGTNTSGWRQVTPPSLLAMTVEEAKSHLRIDHNDDDPDIEMWIQAATEYIESRNVILTPQTWELVLDSFPYCEPIRLWKGPVQSVDFIQYLDVDGVTQTWSASSYQVAKTSKPARIVPAFNEFWPSTRCQMEAVTIRHQVGFNSSPVSIPSSLLSVMRWLIGHCYENREAVVVVQGIVSMELPLSVEAFLDAHIQRVGIYG